MEENYSLEQLKILCKKENRFDYFRNGKHWQSSADYVYMKLEEIPDLRWDLVYLLKKMSEIYWEELQQKSFDPFWEDYKFSYFTDIEDLIIITKPNDKQIIQLGIKIKDFKKFIERFKKEVK